MITYGIVGTVSNIDPDKVYDYHTAFDIKPTEVEYNVDINANQKAIKNVKLDQSSDNNVATIGLVKTLLPHIVNNVYREFFEEYSDFSDANIYGIRHGSSGVIINSFKPNITIPNKDLSIIREDGINVNGYTLTFNPSVVMEMVIVEHQKSPKMTSGASQKISKIPEYAKDFRNEWLFIRGINKKCGEFLKTLDFGGNLFNGPQANSFKYFIKKFLKAQEHGRLKDISGFYLKYFDVNNIDCLEEQLDNYRDLYVDPDSYEFDKECYDMCIDIDYPGFKELFKLISLFNDKIKIENPTFNLNFDSD